MGKTGEVDAATVLLHASGGRALRGVAVDTMSPMVGSQILLKPPEGLPLMGSSKGATSSTICFSSSDKAASFSNDVIEKGWSVAVQIHADAFIGTANMQPLQVIGRRIEDSEQHLSKKVSEACITQCSYIPLKSFQIPRSKMTLSVDALASAQEINNPFRAGSFLNSFNPFLSQSLFYVGGVFFRQVTMKCVEHTSLSYLTSQVQREKGASAGVAVASGGLAAISCARRKKSVIQRDEEFYSKVKEKIESTTTCGPDTGTLKKFRRKLQKDSSCWAIIDKDADKIDDLVGVWELLMQHSKLLDPIDHAGIRKLRRAAKFLCEEWLHIADAHYNLNAPPAREAPLLHRQLVSQSEGFLVTLSSDPMLQVQPRHLAPLLSLRKASLQNPESNPANLNTTAEEVDNPQINTISHCSWIYDAKMEDLLFAHVNASKLSNCSCFHYCRCLERSKRKIMWQCH